MRPYSSSEIDRRLAKIVPELDRFCGIEMTQAELQDFAAVIAASCTSRRLGADASRALLSSLYHLTGRTWSRPVLKRNAHRVVANWYFIAEGMEIPAWDGTKTTADIKILGVARTGASINGKSVLIAKIKLKTGLCAGIIHCGLITDSVIYLFLTRQSGCARFNCADEEISGMEARVTVQVSGGDLRFSDWSCTEAQKKKNRQLAELRSDVSKCYAPVPCNTCSKTIEECPLAVWLPKPKELENGNRQEGTDQTALHESAGGQ